MPKRPGEERKDQQAKHYKSGARGSFQSPDPSEWSFKFHTQKPMVSSDSEDSGAEKDPYKDISFAQDPAEDLGDDLPKDNKPSAPSSAAVVPIAKPMPQPVLIKPAALPPKQNKLIVSPEKPQRQVSWGKDLPAKDPDIHLPIKVEADKGMGKNLSPLQNSDLGNNASQYAEVRPEDFRGLVGNSDFLTPDSES